MNRNIVILENIYWKNMQDCVMVRRLAGQMTIRLHLEVTGRQILA